MHIQDTYRKKYKLDMCSQKIKYHILNLKTSKPIYKIIAHWDITYKKRQIRHNTGQNPDINYQMLDLKN